MAIYHDDIMQGTDEWYNIRLKKLTASDFHVMLGKSQTKTDKLWEIIAERLTGDTDQEPFTGFAAERGKILEAEARRMYSAINETEIKETGFVEPDEGDPWHGFVGSSPDGLIGEDGGLEIKCYYAKNFLQYTEPVEGGGRVITYIKPEVKTQIQFNLMITGRKFWDLMYYHPRFPVAIQRIEPDAELQEKIGQAINECIEFIKNKTQE